MEEFKVTVCIVILALNLWVNLASFLRKNATWNRFTYWLHNRKAR